MNIWEVRKGLRVKRFHTETVLREDTVGHHSANVAALILWLYEPELPPAELLKACILHDVAEYYTGDVPAHTKWEYPELKTLLDRIEEEACKGQGMGEASSRLTNYEHTMLKYADNIELAMKCLHECELGNKTVLTIVDKIIGRLENNMSEKRPLTDIHQHNVNEILSEILEGYEYYCKR